MIIWGGRIASFVSIYKYTETARERMRMATTLQSCCSVKTSALSPAASSNHADGRALASSSHHLPLPLGLSLLPKSLCKPSAIVLRRLEAPRGLRKGGVEPDLPEDTTFDHRTAGEPREGEEDTFPYGIADGHHTYHEGEDGPFWEVVKEEFDSLGAPTGGQAYLAWLSLPALYMGMLFNVQVEYLFIGLVLFIFAYVGIEMAKPPEDHEFPPEIYKERRKKRLSETAARLSETAAK